MISDNQLFLFDECVNGDLLAFEELSGTLFNGFSCLYAICKNNRAIIDTTQPITYQKLGDNSMSFTIITISDAELNCKHNWYGVKVNPVQGDHCITLNIDVMKE